MVRANQLRKKNPSKKTSKKPKNEVDKITLPKEMKIALKEGKTVDSSEDEFAVVTPNKTTESIVEKTYITKRNIFSVNESKENYMKNKFSKTISNHNNIENKRKSKDNDNDNHEEEEEDDDDGFFIVNTNKSINESILVRNINTERITEKSLDNDIFLQGKSNIVGSII